jgi:hypothetical protein
LVDADLEGGRLQEKKKKCGMREIRDKGQTGQNTALERAMVSNGVQTREGTLADCIVVLQFTAQSLA